jgi:hypothetical protein
MLEKFAATARFFDYQEAKRKEDWRDRQ